MAILLFDERRGYVARPKSFYVSFFTVFSYPFLYMGLIIGLIDLNGDSSLYWALFVKADVQFLLRFGTVSLKILILIFQLRVQNGFGSE